MRILLCITCYSVEVESLGPLLGQVVVALSPLVNAYPQQVASIFTFLIAENRYDVTWLCTSVDCSQCVTDIHLYTFLCCKHAFFLEFMKDVCTMCRVYIEIVITILLVCYQFFFRDVLLPYFSEICLMPDHISLKNVNTILQASKQADRRYVCIDVSPTLRVRIPNSLFMRSRLLTSLWEQLHNHSLL